MNNVNLIGRITNDLELKTTNSGTPVISFTIAVDRKFSKDEKVTDFIDCVAWRSTAEFISKYLAKGIKAGFTGELQTRSYEDKNGNKRKATEVVVSDVTFCESKGNTTASIDIPVEEESTNGDLPF